MKIDALALALLFVACLARAESAHTIRATELHADSQSDAATLATVPENSSLDVLQRRGAWTQVKLAGGQTGWVRMLNLRFEAASASGAAGGGADTTGVRGLNEEDLNHAQANPAELQKMLKFTTDKSTAQAFAQRSKLNATKVPYLPDPTPARN
jgi:hypothetical protein